MITNAHITKEARATLQGKWLLVVKVSLAYLAITIISQMIPFIGLLLPLLIDGALMFGLSLFVHKLATGKHASIDNLFEGFTYFGTTFITHVLMLIFIVLWSLLFIIPGIIAALAYSQTFFILTEKPSLGALEAIRQSKDMMRGHKWTFFCLTLRFVGWGILAILTCGIGFIWLIPYVMTSYAHFYEAVKPKHHTAELPTA